MKENLFVHRYKPKIYDFFIVEYYPVFRALFHDTGLQYLSNLNVVKYFGEVSNEIWLGSFCLFFCIYPEVFYLFPTDIERLQRPVSSLILLSSLGGPMPICVNYVDNIFSVMHLYPKQLARWYCSSTVFTEEILSRGPYLHPLVMSVPLLVGQCSKSLNVIYSSWKKKSLSIMRKKFLGHLCYLSVLQNIGRDFL